MRDKRISVLLLQNDLQFNVFLNRGWLDGFVKVENEEKWEKMTQSKHDDNEPRPCEETKTESYERLRNA